MTMKRILNIHPALITVLLILLLLNIFEQLKSNIIENNEDVLIKNTNKNLSKETIEPSILFFDMDEPIDSTITLFDTKKWYTERTSNIEQPSTKSLTTDVTKKMSKTQKEQVKSDKKEKIYHKINQKSDYVIANNETKPVNRSVINETEPKIATAKNIKINYLGKYMDGDKQYVFFEVNGDNKAVAVGDMIDAQTQLTSIDSDRVQVMNINTGINKIINTE